MDHKFEIRLKEILKEKKMKQCELAEKLDVSNITVSRWINGHQFPDKSTLKLLSLTLNVRQEYLEGIDDFKTVSDIYKHSFEILDSFNPTEINEALKSKVKEQIKNDCFTASLKIFNYKKSDIIDWNKYCEFMEYQLQNSIESYMKFCNTTQRKDEENEKNEQNSCK